MFNLDQEKLEKITKIIRAENPTATAETVRAEVCADWHNAEEHQDWINTATAEEIAEWLETFYN